MSDLYRNICISSRIFQFSQLILAKGFYIRDFLVSYLYFMSISELCFLFIFRMVSSYLVHHGYCATAEAFARSTDQTVLEELASIKNRQSKAGKHIASLFSSLKQLSHKAFP